MTGSCEGVVRSILCLVVMAGLICAVTSEAQDVSTVPHPRGVPDYVHTIIAHLNDGRDPWRSEKKCQIAQATEGCSLKDMVVGESTMVYPDSKASGATCIFGDQYGFQVIKGASDKLVFYFQGGGACWDKMSTEAGLCTTTAVPNGATGIFDPSNPNNPFKDYTIVHALYCSGDVWGGNVTQSYHARGHKVTQYGIYNALSVVDWVKEQFSTGVLAPKLSNFVVMGCSAGSVGAQLWSNTLLKTFPNWEKAAVVPDSYAGVFPQGVLGPLIQMFGMCSTTVGLISPELLEACNAGKLNLDDIEDNNIKNSPKGVSVSFIQSKVDVVQMSFYDALGLTEANSDRLVSPTEFYDGVNAIFGRYNKRPNFITFLVDGGQHCFTPINVMYETTPLGPRTGSDGQAVRSSQPGLSTWLATFPMSEAQSAVTECEGTVESSSSSSSSNNNKVGDHDGKNTYCSATVYPKSYEWQ